MNDAAIGSAYATSARHKTHYLAAGPEDGPLIVFVHGWPELSLSWRHQLPVMAGLGFRVVAPDMRGYGKSSVYDTHEAYAQREVVADMLELLDSLGRERAVWVGHDWGSPTVWALAQLYPQRCSAVASLCVPYIPAADGPESMAGLIDRDIYPADEYPLGQWDYMMYYHESFNDATAAFDADPERTMKALFRAGDPAGAGQPAMTASVRRNGGWFGPAGVAPDLPIDTRVVNADDMAVYVDGLRQNTFFGPDSYYMNTVQNAAFTAGAAETLDLPVLFLHARYDYVCETVNSRLAEPMRRHCNDLSEVVVDSGHWMAQERPQAVNAALARWLATRVGECWPQPDSNG